MEVIWKYGLPIVDRQAVMMPVGAEILSVQEQAGGLQLWAVVVPEEKRHEQRMIEIVGTGNPMPDVLAEGLTRYHLATVQTAGGSLVWHVFELL